MTPQEYVQLKAFARQDGALLSLLWIGAFACYVMGFARPPLLLLALLMMVATPFFVAIRLRSFREKGREGRITFGLGYAHCILTFFYGGLLLAAACFIYFAFLDQGYLVTQVSALFHSPEGKQAIKLYGMSHEIEESLRVMSELRPIDYALNLLSSCILQGFVWGLPLAFIMRRSQPNK